jgi:hypothetical protein
MASLEIGKVKSVMNSKDKDNRYETVKVYSEGQKTCIAMHEQQARAGTLLGIEPVGAPEEEVTQLRSLTNEEQWELKDNIKSIEMLIDSLVDDCFTYDRKCGWRIKRR